MLPSLLYGCETWTPYRKHLKQLERFHMNSLRSILNIKWQDRIPNTEVLSMAESTSIEAIILKSRLRWVGHVIRMENTRLPKQLFYGELSSGKRKQGRPRKRYKDAVKENLNHLNITPNELETRAQDRMGWRTLTKASVCMFETDRQAHLRETRMRRKASVDIPSDCDSLTCPRCARACRSRIGLHSHIRAHDRRDE